MKNVMVTGAAGFLGSHIMLRHLEAGDAVLGVDNYSSSNRDSSHVRKIWSYTPTNRMQLADIDVKNRDDLFRVVRDFVGVIAFNHGYDSDKKSTNCGLDIIYNMACPASPPIYQKKPIDTLMTCVVGMKNVIDVSMNGLPRVYDPQPVIVHASTSEVYGDPDVSPQHESYRGCVNSFGPRACYDEGKRAAEALCFDYINKHGVDVRLARIFNTYGPHMNPDDGRVVSNFIVQALRGEKITIYGDGSQTRSFCYVDDMVDAFFALAELKSNPGSPINVGNPNEFTINELADLVRNLLDAKVSWQSLPIDDPKQRRPDITRAMKELNWYPKVQLEEGIISTIKYFKQVITNE